MTSNVHLRAAAHFTPIAIYFSPATRHHPGSRRSQRGPFSARQSADWRLFRARRARLTHDDEPTVNARAHPPGRLCRAAGTRPRRRGLGGGQQEPVRSSAGEHRRVEVVRELVYCSAWAGEIVRVGGRLGADLRASPTCGGTCAPGRLHDGDATRAVPHPSGTASRLLPSVSKCSCLISVLFPCRADLRLPPWCCVCFGCCRRPSLSRPRISPFTRRTSL